LTQETACVSLSAVPTTKSYQAVAFAGDRLREWRHDNEVTLAELAAHLNKRLEAHGTKRRTDDAQLSRIERGVERPGLLLAACIEVLTGVPAVSWVLVA
jgi:hypothetical protein